MQFDFTHHYLAYVDNALFKSIGVFERSVGRNILGRWLNKIKKNSIAYINHFMSSEYCQYPVQDDQCLKLQGHNWHVCYKDRIFWQHCSRCAWQISEQLENFKPNVLDENDTTVYMATISM